MSQALVQRLADIPGKIKNDEVVDVPRTMTDVIVENERRKSLVALGETKLQKSADVIINYLTKNPDSEPSVRAYLFGQLLTQDANAAVTNFAHELEGLRRNNPQAHKLLEILISGYCVATRKRIIDDEKVQRSLRQKRKKRGLLKRAFSHLTGSNQEIEILEEIEDAAALLEGLKLEQADLKAKNTESISLTQTTLENTAKEARQMIDSARQDVAAMECKKAILADEIKDLENYLSQIRQNPEAADHITKIDAEMITAAETIIIEIRRIITGLITIKPRVSECYGIIFGIIIPTMMQLETQFGKEKIKSLAIKIIDMLRPYSDFQRTLGEQVQLRGDDLVTLFSIIAYGQEPKNSMSALLKIYRENFSCQTFNYTSEEADIKIGWKKIHALKNSA